MRLHTEVIVNAKPTAVWQFYNDIENTGRWQPALKSQTHLSGTPGEVGAVYEVVHDHNGRELKSISTILEMTEFETISISSDSDFSFTTMSFLFKPTGKGRTRLKLDIDYRFKGLYRLPAFFFRRSMRARAEDELRRVKQILEADSQE